ncbi:MAG: hypothetical protein ACI8QC_004568, partial [Planctomycetota bacterium]
MEAITLPCPELDLNSYEPPTQDVLDYRKKQDVKF